MEFEKDLFFIEDFHTMVTSLVVFIKKLQDKFQRKHHLGSDLIDDCVLYFNREKWKKLMAFMIEK